ncbi:MAG: arginine deiminase family protein [Burkholderiaceae bacterium]
MKNDEAELDPKRSAAAGKPGAPLPVSPSLGVYSEVGKLRAALVCRPGLAHERLSPRTCRELKFDTPVWVERARREFAQFVGALTQQGVEVLELHTLLAQTLALPEARAWLLDRLLAHLCAATGLGVEARAACDEFDAAQLAELLIGGVTLDDLGLPAHGAMGLALALHPFVLPPLPHSLTIRASHSWVQCGLTLNLAARRGPRSEALLVAAVYRFHPRFDAMQPRVWWGDTEPGSLHACAEGGDIMALGRGVVLIGTGARTQARAAVQIAHALFEGGAAQNVIAAQLPQPGASEPLERVFTQCSPDVVSYRPDMVDRISCQELRPTARGTGVTAHPRAGEHLLDILSEALGAPTFKTIVSGCDSHDGTGEPWDDGNGVLAVDRGVVIAFERNTRTNKRLRQAGVEVIEVPCSELARAGATAHGLCCPIVRDAVH